ncbi:hypothetical protein, partial [Mesorhizobium sp. WSM4303]|uniref:hypothetical protein n=1 Tax=Mesorhizobium sp. WSM4303 TaxID=2589887 RepID=UPI001AED2829
LKVTGSNPVPATNIKKARHKRAFLYFAVGAGRVGSTTAACSSLSVTFRLAEDPCCAMLDAECMAA